MATRYVLISLWIALFGALAQLPPSGTLSEGDWTLFRAEVARVERLLTSASDKDTAIYEMARTWASAKQWPEATRWLQRVAELKAGLDPSRGSLFAELRGTREFAE